MTVHPLHTVCIEAGRSQDCTPEGEINFIPLSKMSKPSLGPTKPPIQWVPGFFPGGGVKWLELEADHSPPSNADITNEWSRISTPPIRLYGVDRQDLVYLTKKRDTKRSEYYRLL